MITAGDYVLATKYQDGDPADHWFVGFYDRTEKDRHFVKGIDGRQGRGNGFRRVEKIAADEGEWLLKTQKLEDWEREPPGCPSVWDRLDAYRKAKAAADVTTYRQFLGN